MLFCSTAVFLAGCANVVMPSGGEKDTTAPKFISSSPENGSTNIQPKEIQINFNEFIELKNKRDNIIISPPIQNYKVIGKRKSVVVEIADTLKDDATYSIQFGESIRDLREGNAIKGFEYVFSTGDQLDSLSLEGKVIDAFTKDSIPESSLLLYKNFDDSVVKNTRPFYYTKVTSEGSYSFEHLKEGDYNVYGLKDLNGNLKYDPGEKVGFYPDTLRLKSDTVIRPIELFSQDLERPEILNVSMASRGKVELTFNQEIDTFMLTGKSSEKGEYFWRLKKGGKEGIIWFEPRNNLTIKQAVSIDKKFYDTFEVVRDTGYLEDESNRDTTFIINKIDEIVKPQYPINVWLNKPVDTFWKPKIDVLKDSVSQGFDSLMFLNYNKTKIGVFGNYRFDSMYRIVFADSAFKSIDEDYSKEKEEILIKRKPEKFGNLEIVGELDSTIKSAVIYLKTKKGNIVQKDVIDGVRNEIFYKNLDPGNYFIKAIIDKNGNGFWDEGNIFKRKMPERVVKYPGSITVKENWELKDVKFKIVKR